MEQWDEPAADAAIAALVRRAGPESIWPHFFRYGGRDYRSIGHKAIDVANTHCVLGLIGWQHAEPALRSLASALLMHEDGNPANRDAPADRPWRRNQERVKRIPDRWSQGEADADATRALLHTLRDGSEDEAADRVVELLARGAGPQSIWDALFLGSAELVVRQPGIVALHSLTTTNALHYCYHAAKSDENRKLILLQNAAFLPMFRQSMHGRGRVGDFAIDELKPQETSSDPIAEIFHDVRNSSQAAAQKTLNYFQGGGEFDPWADRARHLVVEKGTGVHDYKYACAAIEDAEKLSPQWRGHYLGAATYLLSGATEEDNPLIEHAREALHG